MLQICTIWYDLLMSLKLTLSVCIVCSDIRKSFVITCTVPLTWLSFGIVLCLSVIVNSCSKYYFCTKTFIYYLQWVTLKISNYKTSKFIVTKLVFTSSFINYLQLPHSKVEGILLYQGFPRPILPKKRPDRSEVCFVDRISQQSSCTQFYRLLRWKCANFFMKTSQRGWLFYLTSLCCGNHGSVIWVTRREIKW